jgi:hypothetical protein
MVNKEYGVDCVKCKSFIRIGSYEFDPPLKNAPQFFPSEGGVTLPCVCGTVCVYREVDVYHRVSGQSAAG